MRSALVLATFVVTAAVASAATGPAKKIDRDSASGSTVAVFVSGEVMRPRKFIITMKSAPTGQPVEGTASISCRDKAYNFADRTGPVASVTPARVKIPLTKRRAAHCSVGISASAIFGPDDSSTGRLTAKLFVKRKR